MHQHVSLVLTASFLFLSQGVQASSIDDDNPSVAQGAGGVQVVSAVTAVTSSTSEDLQCYRKINGQLEPMFDDAGKLLDRRAQEPRSESTMTSVEKDGKKLWTNVLSSLAHHVRVAVMEFLQDDPRGQLSLMTVSHGFRRLALVMPERYNDAASTGNALKQRLLTVLIGGQTGDVALFMQDHVADYSHFTLPQLESLVDQNALVGALDPKTPARRAYFELKAEFKDMSKVEVYCWTNGLRLCPPLRDATHLTGLSFSHNRLTSVLGLSHLTNLQYLNLSKNQLTVAPVLTGLTGLQRLDLSHNQLTVAPVLTGLTGLQWLDLSKNQLTVAPVLTGLTNLERLGLSHNQITTAPVLTGLPNLQLLYLSDNKLKVAPVVTGLPKLGWLSLDSNLCGDPTLLETLRGLNRGRANGYKIIYAFS